jgi:hypothetical protein
MGFLSDAVDWVDDEIITPTAHYVNNIVNHPYVPLMIMGGVAVSVLAPEFLPAMLPFAAEAAGVGVAAEAAVGAGVAAEAAVGAGVAAEAAVGAGVAAEAAVGASAAPIAASTGASLAAEAATEAVAAAEAADIGMGAAELAAESESSLLVEQTVPRYNLYNDIMASEDASALSSSVDRIGQEEAINLGEYQRATNLPSRFNKLEQLLKRSNQASQAHKLLKYVLPNDDYGYPKRQRLENSNGSNNNNNNNTPQPPPGGDSKDPSWNDPGSTNRQGALHDLGLWRANASQTNFATTPIVPRDMDDDPKMSQSGDFLRSRQNNRRR